MFKLVRRKVIPQSHWGAMLSPNTTRDMCEDDLCGSLGPGKDCEVQVTRRRIERNFLTFMGWASLVCGGLSIQVKTKQPNNPFK